jgi:hypothetical protein
MLAEAKPELLTLQGPVVDALRTQLGLDDEVLAKLAQPDLGMAGDIDLEVKVVNGRGEWKSILLPTFGSTFTGTVKIQEPEKFSWFVTVRDTHAGRTIYQGPMYYNTPVPFSYKTGLLAQFQVTVACSERVNTILKAKITYTF